MFRRMKKCLLSFVCAGLLAACQQAVHFPTLVHHTESANSLREYLAHHQVDVDERYSEDSAFARPGSNSLFYIDVGGDDGFNYAVEIARVLVQHGADVNAVDCKGNTPLLALPGIGTQYYEDRGEVQAALDMVDFYVSAGADLFAHNKAGYNALDLALSTRHDYSGNERMVKKLKKWGLNPHSIANWCGVPPCRI